MQRKRAHQHCVTAFGETGDLAQVFDRRRDVGVSEDSETMTAGRNTQRPVGLVAIIEMKANCEQSFQDRAWWAGVVDTVFHGG